ncbi:hypothetical protein SHIRM173S_11658 [Streptomyces hirsutus]
MRSPSPAKNRERVIAVESERIEKDRMLEVIARERETELTRIAADKEVEAEKRDIAEVVRERVAVDRTVAEQGGVDQEAAGRGGGRAGAAGRRESPPRPRRRRGWSRTSRPRRPPRWPPRTAPPRN